ncbi:MAG: CAP domain-containing protein [Alphaproteobacteria bacterium]|nr:CAP domain-containing protein [Alphaproteobacteria bacterium]MCB9695340.1 CAP domain-containing protein [Alphaproteobacteria bacterium]
MRSVLLLGLTAACVVVDDPTVGEGFSTTAWDDGWASFEDEVLAQVNEQRAAGGRCGTANFPPSAPLEHDVTLRGLARWYSRWMAEDGFFDHVDPNGDDPFDRMSDAGFTGATPWGENIAAGYPDPDQVMAGWMSSPGHCANILEPGYAVIGIGYYDLPDDPALMQHYWTQEFAASH